MESLVLSIAIKHNMSTERLDPDFNIVLTSEPENMINNRLQKTTALTSCVLI